MSVFIGCFNDQDWPLPGELDGIIHFYQNSLTIQYCIAMCKYSNYKYAGLTGG